MLNVPRSHSNLSRVSGKVSLSRSSRRSHLVESRAGSRGHSTMPFPVRPCVEVSRDKMKSLRKWMFEGLSPSEAKALRKIFTPVFESSLVPYP